MAPSMPLNKMPIQLFINAAIVIALCFAVMSFFSKEHGFVELFLAHVNTVIHAAACYVPVILYSAFIWRMILCKVSDIKAPFTLAFRHVFIMLSAKYIPGKVWGLALRSLDLANKGMNLDANFRVNFIEQYFSVVVAIFISLALIFIDSVRLTMGVLVLLIPITYYLQRFILTQTPRFISIIPKLRHYQKLSHDSNLSFTVYAHLFFHYLLYWLVGALVLYILVSKSWVIDVELYKIVSGVFLLGAVGGYMAVFVPGGIGVREAIWFVLLNAYVDPEQLLNAVILHRIILTLFDVFCASLALLIKSCDSNET